MAANLETKPEPSVGELLKGIVNDAQELFSQQLTLFKKEVQQDFRDTREIAVSLGVAAGLSAFAGLLLSFMLVHLLHEVAGLQRWVSFAIVGGAWTLIAGGVFVYARQRLKTVNPLPEKTVQALEENLEWKTKPR